MKVKIIDNNNVHTEIDPRSLDIDGKTLLTMMREFKQLKDEFIKLKDEIIKREEDLMKIWQSIK
jgi:hypothetical protein